MKANLVLIAIVLFAASLSIFGQIPLTVEVNTKRIPASKIAEQVENKISANPEYKVLKFSEMHTSGRNVHTLKVWTESGKVGEAVKVFEEPDVKKHTALKAMGAQAARIGGSIVGTSVANSGYYSVARNQIGYSIIYASERMAENMEREIYGSMNKGPVEIGHVTQVRIFVKWQRVWNGGSTPVQTHYVDFYVYTSNQLINGSKYFLLAGLNGSLETSEPIPGLDWLGYVEAKTYAASMWGQ